MPRKRTVGLSAGEAVLGLVIEQPDSASQLGRRLVERFRSAQFTRSTGHNALTRLDPSGACACSHRRREPRRARSATRRRRRDIEHFRAWLRASSTAAPALREELQAKIAFCAPDDLPRLIDAICAEERACASMFAAAQGRLSAAELVAPRCSDRRRAVLAAARTERCCATKRRCGGCASSASSGCARVWRRCATRCSPWPNGSTGPSPAEIQAPARAARA